MKLTPLIATAAIFALSTVAVQAADGTPVKICHENEDSYPWIFKDRPGLTTSLLKMA